MAKMFKVNDGTAEEFDDLDLSAAFGFWISEGAMTDDEAQAIFDSVAVGETFTDEDGDVWERTA